MLAPKVIDTPQYLVRRGWIDAIAVNMAIDQGDSAHIADARRQNAGMLETAAQFELLVGSA